MTDLASILSRPIAWADGAIDPALRSFLDDLQANILKGHGRHHTVNLFLGFGGMDPAEVGRVVRLLGNHCTSAYRQLRTNRKRPPHIDGGPVRCLFLTASGYRALGSGVLVPGGKAFEQGMGGRGAVLADPPRTAWNAVGWRNTPPDAMMLIANATPGPLEPELEAIEGWLNGTGVKVLFVERGLQQTRSFQKGKPEGVEHFGYVDGRSQPLVLAEDVTAEAIPPEDAEPGEKRQWDPAFSPSQFIIHDPNGHSPLSAGSYFVFRKLEQDVRGFNAAEDELAETIFGKDADDVQRDRAGAMVVGRFEDGTPLTLFAEEQKTDVTNDFSYADDRDGLKCPFHAHIRKTNPRGDIERTFGTPDEGGGRDPIMIRRGITYGPERPHNADRSEFADKGQEPRTGSGLLFMAYMASIEAQFEFTQRSWATNPDFVRPGTGIDPVIGQTDSPAEMKHTYQDGWTGGPPVPDVGFAKFVTMQGGEYFFAPSLSFLRGAGLGRSGEMPSSEMG